MAKVNEQIKNSVLLDYENGLSQRQISRKYSLSLGTINKIVNNDYTTSKTNKKSHRPDGSIYLIGFKQNNNIYVKIGVAVDIGLRVKSLQTGNPFELEIFGEKYFKNSYTIENEIHKKFTQYNFKNEWFLLQEEQLKEIKEFVYEIN